MLARLLVVEDEPGIEKIFKGRYRKEIKKGQYEFIFAKSGEEALEILENDTEIDLIITDLKMPASKINGFELIKILRKRHIDIKIIVLSAYKNEYQFTQSEQKNVLFFIDKETEKETFDELTSLVETSVDNSSLTALKNLVELSLDFPDHLDPNSQRVRLDTLIKVIKDLPESKKNKLFLKLLDYLPYNNIKWLKEELPKAIENVLEKSYRQEELRQWLLLQQKTQKISPNIPLDIIEYFFIESRPLPSGPYYYLKWSENGRWKSKYLPKKLIENGLPLHLKQAIRGSVESE